jgi:hypothetical protein
MYRPGHREHVAALLAGVPRGDQRTGAGGCLDHQHAARQPRHEPVALREILCERRRAGRELGHQRAAARDLGREARVLRGIHAVEAGAADGDRHAARRQRAAVRGGVDAGGEPARDRETPGCERGRELERGLAAGRGGRATADDRELRQRERRGIAAHEERVGAPAHGGELRRVARVTGVQQRPAGRSWGRAWVHRAILDGVRVPAAAQIARKRPDSTQAAVAAGGRGYLSPLAQLKSRAVSPGSTWPVASAAFQAA